MDSRSLYWRIPFIIHFSGLKRLLILDSQFEKKDSYLLLWIVSGSLIRCPSSWDSYPPNGREPIPILVKSQNHSQVVCSKTEKKMVVFKIEIMMDFFIDPIDARSSICKSFYDGVLFWFRIFILDCFSVMHKFSSANEVDLSQFYMSR